MFGWGNSEITEFKSTNLISFSGEKIILHELNLPDIKDITVFSIIGTARTGKSTLLNCTSSYILKKNVKIFNIDDTDEHCTIGIDMYYFEKEKIILLDCQGLKLDDSSNDPKLLLIVYLISDCIIYNQRSMLNNDIFETLQPLCTFVNYIENIKQKPELIFRILDSELKYEPAKMLEKTLSPKKDQFQNTREAMTNLFSHIDLCITYSLDRKEKKMLSERKFYDFICGEENNFSQTITNILLKKDNVSNKKSISQWYKLIGEYIITINSNRKIDFNKLDIYQICIEKEILEFFLGINQDNYKDFSCGILQEDYIKNVEPKLEYLQNVLKMFETKFKMASKNIFDKYYSEIKTKLNTPILNVIKSIEEQTIARIQVEADIFFESHNKTLIFTPKASITKLDDANVLNNKLDNVSLVDSISTKIYDFLKSIEKYYGPVVLIIKEKYLNYLQTIKENMESIIKLNNENYVNLENEFKYYESEYKKIYPLLLKTKLFNISYFDKYFDWDYNKCLKIIPITIFNNLDNLIKANSDDEFLDQFNFENSSNFKSRIIDKYSKYYKLKLVFNSCKSEIKCVHKVEKYSFKNKYYKKINNFIDNKFSDLEKIITNDPIIKKIIKTKSQQNKYIIKKDIIVKEQDIDDFLFSKLCIPFPNNTYTDTDTEIDKKLIKQHLCLVEFTKYLRKKFNKKVILDKEKVLQNLILYKYNKQLYSLYKDFLKERHLLLGKIDGIKLV